MTVRRSISFIKKFRDKICITDILRHSSDVLFRPQANS